MNIVTETRFDNGEEETIDQTEECQFDKLMAECEGENSGKEANSNPKRTKTTNKTITTVLKKVGNKIQKLVNGADWSDNTGAILNLVKTTVHLAQLRDNDQVNEETINGIFELNWMWDDNCVEKIRKELGEPENTGEEKTETIGAEQENCLPDRNLKEKIIEEIINFYNKKVRY